MYSENNLAKEFYELKLLVNGLSKVSGFPSELLSLIEQKIANIEKLSASSDYIADEKPEVKSEEVLPQIKNDIFRLLTINDKFRFQRELFGNNPEKMKDVFSKINSFDNYSDAIDFFNDECFDYRETDCFTEFCGLIENKFS